MITEKVLKLIVPFLFAIGFGWTLYSILSYDGYYHGEPLTKFNIIINERPKFYYDGNTKISFYAFTTLKYKNEFRISNGSNHLVRENEIITKEIENIKNEDTIELAILKSDIKKLKNNSEIIKVVGLTIKNKLLIDPEKVKDYDRINKRENLFFNYLILVGLIIFGIRVYTKSRIKK